MRSNFKAQSDTHFRFKWTKMISRRQSNDARRHGVSLAVINPLCTAKTMSSRIKISRSTTKQQRAELRLCLPLCIRFSGVCSQAKAVLSFSSFLSFSLWFIASFGFGMFLRRSAVSMCVFSGNVRQSPWHRDVCYTATAVAVVYHINMPKWNAIINYTVDCYCARRLEFVLFPSSAWIIDIVDDF